MAAMKALVAAATIMLMIQLAMATTFTVGSPTGSWDLTTNLTAWVKANTFVVGDNLNFSYSPAQHDVVEVTKANYASCSTSSPIKTYTTGNDVIPLPSATTRYFICGFTGHCQAGMKVTINVSAAATPPSTPAPTPSPSSPPPSHSTPATSPTGSPPPSGSTPAPPTPTATPPPSGSTPAPTSPSTPSPATPSTPSGANSHNLQAKAAVGFGLGMLMFLAL